MNQNATLKVVRCTQFFEKSQCLWALVVHFTIPPCYYRTPLVLSQIEPWIASFFDERITFISHMPNNKGVWAKYKTHGTHIMVMLNGESMGNSNVAVFYSQDKGIVDLINQQTGLRLSAKSMQSKVSPIQAKT